MEQPDLITRLVLRGLPNAFGAEGGDIAQMRAKIDRPSPWQAWTRAGLAAVHEGVVPGAAGPIRARLYVPRRARGLVLFMHGGGFVLCGLDSHEGICVALARSSRASVLSIDYRLAPEHPFPAATEDCFAAYNWLVSNADRLGRGNPRIAVAGDSAGGNLAAVLCLMARDRGGVVPPRLQLLFYPPTTGREDVPSRTQFGEGYMLTRAMMSWFERQYLGGDREEPSPYYMPGRGADLGHLPPAVIVTAAFDPMRDEGALYAERLRAAGVEARYACIPGTVHGFLNFAAIMPKARRVLRRSGRAIRRALEA